MTLTRESVVHGARRLGAAAMLVVGTLSVAALIEGVAEHNHSDTLSRSVMKHEDQGTAYRESGNIELAQTEYDKSSDALALAYYLDKDGTKKIGAGEIGLAAMSLVGVGLAGRTVATLVLSRPEDQTSST